MNPKDIFLVISIIAALTTPIIGIYSIVRGSFRPQRMTRLLIFLISLLFVGTLLAQNDRNGIFIAIPQLIGGFVIFVLSLKKGIGGKGKMDIVVFIMAILSLIIWQTTNNPILGLIMSIVTDIIAFSPTLVKTWNLPHTEEWKFYMSDVVASTFSILSIKSYTYASLIFPIYILLINTTSVLMIHLRKRVLSK
jgi:hypothetical protein